MRVVTWNCQGGFRYKANAILNLKPDVLCVQEIESPDGIDFSKHIAEPNSLVWYGEGKVKGLGVLSYNSASVSKIESHNKLFRHVLPIECVIDNVKMNIFNVWTKQKGKSESHNLTYIDYVIEALPFYSDLNYDKSMFIGDLNADTVVTTGQRFEKAISLFESYGMKSLYHEYSKSDFNEEKQPTSYHRRDIKKPFHIDYAFSSKYFIDRTERVEIGTFEDWGDLSDHMPIILDFNHL